jgi:hypothetical protein
VYFEKDDTQLARENHWRDDTWAGDSYHPPHANPIRMRGHSPPRYRRSGNTRAAQPVEDSQESSSSSSSDEEKENDENRKGDESSSERSSEEDSKPSRKETISKKKVKSKSHPYKGESRANEFEPPKKKSKSRKGKERDTD